MNIGKIFDDLEKNGISIIEKNYNDNELISFAKKMGIIVPDDNGLDIQILTPKKQGEGIRDSFGYNYGLKDYPYHIDTAFWPIPARYLILKSEYKSDCNTYYLRFEDIFSYFTKEEIKQINHASCLIKTFNVRRFTSLKFKVNHIVGFRYDPNTISGYNNEAKICLTRIEEIIKLISPQKIEWTGKNFIILDNWKGVHARSSVLDHENRILKRIYVK